MAGTSPAMTNESLPSRLLVLLMHGLSTVMPGFMPASTSLILQGRRDVDGRDKPGHDECGSAAGHQ